MPRISVVMAIYNGERYLREAIESILNQTVGDFEFLIIDDGSTDGTRTILSSYEDPRIRVIENRENLGLARSLNRGLRAARGELIARQDADDLSEPKRFERQVAFLDEHPEVALLGSSYRIIDEQGRLRDSVEVPCSWLELRWAMHFWCPFPHSGVMLRRARVLETVGLYDEALSYSLDFDLWRRIARVHPVANIGTPLVRYRVHDSSMSATFGERSHEGQRLRAATIARLLGWDEGEMEKNRSRCEAMRALQSGWETGAEPATLHRAAEDLLSLQHAFCQEERLTRQEAERHRTALAAVVGQHLVLLARTSRSADLAQRWALLRRAYRLDRSVYLRPRTLLRSGVALLRGVLPSQRGSRISTAVAP